MVHMNSLLYVIKTGYKNKLKKSLHKPTFYLYVLFIGCYLVMMYQAFYTMVVKGGFNSPKILVMVLSVIVLYFGPMNYASYAKRKGLYFLPCHVHFLFTAPISPKLMLIFGQFRTQIMGMIMEILMVFVGIFWFGIPFYLMFLYFVISCLSTVIEGCTVICLYGGERFEEKTMKRISSAIWLVLGAIVAVTGIYILQNGFSLQTVLNFLLSDWICYLPVIGWQIAAIRLVLLDPSFAAAAGTVLYLLFGGLMLTMAVRMRCTGEFYENAMKFADDYQQIINKKKKGDVSSGFKIAKANRKASVAYKGSGAKAIFYRKLLEYKKSRFFIFGGQTVCSLIVAVGLPILVSIGEISIKGEARYYTIFGVMAYIYLIFGNYQTKWEKELDNAYVFLIPASPLSKIWYATLMEHIRVMADALIMAVSYCVVLALPLYYIPVIILGAVSMKAVKLYSDTICNVIIGQALGNTARLMLRMIISWTVIGIAVPIVLVVQFVLEPVSAVLCGCLYLLLAAGALMLGGSHAFSQMELRDS